MSKEKKLGPSDFQAEIVRLQKEGKMPPLEDVLAAVAGVRDKYAPAIMEARNEGE